MLFLSWHRRGPDRLLAEYRALGTPLFKVKTCDPGVLLAWTHAEPIPKRAAACVAAGNRSPVPLPEARVIGGA